MIADPQAHLPRKTAPKAEPVAAPAPVPVAESKPRRIRKAAPAVEAAAPAPASDADPEKSTHYGSIVCIDAEMYFRSRLGNMFAYDPINDEVGDYVGRMAADGNSVDTAAHRRLRDNRA